MIFQDLLKSKNLLAALEKKGFQVPTPIQEKVIPLVEAGHDVLGIAQTGTGKTAAYLLPILEKLNYAQDNRVRAIVLAPTRELVLQIYQVALEFGEFTDLRIAAIYGGNSLKTQVKAIEKGLDLLISTPQRLIDVYLTGELPIKLLKTLVLDEADKMLDMGFLPQIRRILEIIPVKRQNLLFSATFSEKVEQLSFEFLDFPQKVEITPQATTAQNVSHFAYKVPNKQAKYDFLFYYLKKHKPDKVLIFCRSKPLANELFTKMFPLSKSWIIGILHGNKGQNTRINTLDSFKEENQSILIATDIVSRGIDVENINLVINFDVPLIYEDYVHRIGRTGRAFSKGIALSLVTIAEEYSLEKIEDLIKMKIEIRELPPEIIILETPFEEQQAYLKSLDHQTRRNDPDFKGAFHEKKTFKFKKKTQNKHKSK